MHLFIHHICFFYIPIENLNHNPLLVLYKHIPHKVVYGNWVWYTQLL